MTMVLSRWNSWLRAVVMTAVSCIAMQSSYAVCPALLNHSFPKLQDESTQSLCQFEGKVALVVNTASYCGYTSQYEGLEKLYAQYRDRGFVVLGFPSNDFGRQEPGSNKEIADFCFNTYSVKFPMFAKSSVVGANTNSLFKQLSEASGSRPRWNFHKYLVDRNGQVVATFASSTSPLDRKLTSEIERLLEAR